MAEVLFILAIATKEVTENKAGESTRPSPPTSRAAIWVQRYQSLPDHFFVSEWILKGLVGMTEIRDALQRLEKLVQEEVRMVTDGVAHAAARISGEVEKVGDQVIRGAQIMVPLQSRAQS